MKRVGNPLSILGGGRLVETSLPRAAGVLLLVGFVAEFAEVGIVALGGEEVFTNADLTSACDVIIAESFFPDAEGIAPHPELREDHEHDNGWYSELVLAQTLRNVADAATP